MLCHRQRRLLPIACAAALAMQQCLHRLHTVLTGNFHFSNQTCCRHFAREIAAYDIQTKRCDVYGQGEGYPERVMLIYDGLHYDALALAGTHTNNNKSNCNNHDNNNNDNTNNKSNNSNKQVAFQLMMS